MINNYELAIIDFFLSVSNSNKIDESKQVLATEIVFRGDLLHISSLTSLNVKVFLSLNVNPRCYLKLVSTFLSSPLILHKDNFLP